ARVCWRRGVGERRACGGVVAAVMSQAGSAERDASGRRVVAELCDHCERGRFVELVDRRGRQLREIDRPRRGRAGGACLVGLFTLDPLGGGFGTARTEDEYED